MMNTRRTLTAGMLAEIAVAQGQGMAYVWGRHDARGYGAGDSQQFGRAWADAVQASLSWGTGRPSIAEGYAAWRAGLPIGTDPAEIMSVLRAKGLMPEIYPLAPEVLSAAIGPASAPPA